MSTKHKPPAIPTAEFQQHAERLAEHFGFQLDGEWVEECLRVVEESSTRFFALFPRESPLQQWAKSLVVRLQGMSHGGMTQVNLVRLNPVNLTTWTVAHEFAHAWDASLGWRLSRQLKAETGSGFTFKFIHTKWPRWKFFWYYAGSPPPPCGVDKNFTAAEDFAETVAAYIFPEEAKRRAAARGYPYEKWGYQHFHDTPRGQFLKRLLEAEKKDAPML